MTVISIFKARQKISLIGWNELLCQAKISFLFLNKAAISPDDWNVHTAALLTCVQVLASGCWQSRGNQRRCFMWRLDRLSSFRLWCPVLWLWLVMLLEGGTTGPMTVATFTEVMGNTVGGYTPVSSCMRSVVLCFETSVVQFWADSFWDFCM